MAWQTPKTDWLSNPHNLTSEDLNRIEGNIEFLNTDIETKKGLIVDAIIAKGIAASIADTFSTLANKIGYILRSFGTATSDKVLSGYTFSNDTQSNIQGTMPSKAAATITPSTINQVISAGQYLSGAQTIAGDADLITGNIKAGANIFGVAGKSSVVDTADASIPNAAYMYSGVTAYKNGAKLTGTMPLRGGTAVTLTSQGQQHSIPYGYHDGGTVQASFANLSAGNVKNGVNIGGIVGTFTGVMSGTVLIDIDKVNFTASGPGLTRALSSSKIYVAAFGYDSYNPLYQNLCLIKNNVATHLIGGFLSSGGGTGYRMNGATIEYYNGNGFNKAAALLIEFSL